MLNHHSHPQHEKLIFTTMMLPDKSTERNAILLADSIRSFAGTLSQNPIWCLVPDREKPISPDVREKLTNLNITIIPFQTDHEAHHFPFADLVLAAALTESMARDRTDLLAWLAPNTIVLREPKDFHLPDDKILGYRPVHHTLIGSRFNEPLDPFWTLIYDYCKVPHDRIFPMVTDVDDVKVRPYFNAGFLVMRPHRYLFQTWRDTFLKIYKRFSLHQFYEHDIRYKIFIHQAVLSAVILSTLTTTEIQELPSSYNYPLHLYEQDVTKDRPRYLEEVVTFRHEGIPKERELIQRMPAKDPLKQWFIERALH